MAQAEVEVAKSKSQLVTRYKERIELLFDVVVSVKIPSCKSVSEDGSLHTTFVLQLSSASQESITKAIVFLQAVLGESPDFTVEQQSLSHEEFEMVLKDSRSIERASLAVVDFDVNTFEVCMKGQRDCVEKGKWHVHKLIMGQDEAKDAMSEQGPKVSQVTGLSGNSSAQQHQGVQLISPSSSPTKTEDEIDGMLASQLDKTPDMFHSSFRDVDNNVILGQTQTDSLQSFDLATDSEDDGPPDSCPVLDLLPRGQDDSMRLSRTFAQVVSVNEAGNAADTWSANDNDARRLELNHQDVSSDPASSASSDEDSCSVGGVDKQDSRYEGRLEFALKLGYTEGHLDRIINRHGLECDENKLLRELIESSVGTGSVVDNDLVTDSELPSQPQAVPDMSNAEVFLGVIQQVTKAEPSGNNLRGIVIDGSNVAMSHGKNVFSCRGIKIAVDWFKQRGHTEITVFVPQWRKEASRPDTPITDQEILTELEREGIVVFTPARRIKGRRVVCYDDRFVLKLAAETDRIVVSNDNYRDLLNENQEYRTVVDERLLMYTFVNDRFMPPEDPLGRRGPTLDNFLRKEPTCPPTLPPECPYGRKCTYGNKCKYHHPERGSQPHRTVTEVLKEQANKKMLERAVKGQEALDKARRGAGKPKLTRTRSLAPGEPLPSEKSTNSLPLPSDLQELEVDMFNPVRSPTKTLGGKTSDYLREHRKKLEETLASAPSSSPVTDPTVTSPKPLTQLVATERPVTEASAVRRPQEVRSPVSPALGTRVPSPTLLNVPLPPRQEGQLVSGHLLLAKKLSDEASEASFFSNENTLASPSSSRGAPVTSRTGPALARNSQPELSPSHHSLGKFQTRRASLQDCHPSHQSQQYYPSSALRREAGTGFSARLVSGYTQNDQVFASVPVPSTQSFPATEKESPRNVLRRVTSHSDHFHPTYVSATVGGGSGMDSGHREHVPLKAQYSCPPGHLMQNPASFSSRPFRGMMRQNSSSDPQLHISGSGEGSFPWHASPSHHAVSPAMDSHGNRPMYYSAGPGHRTVSESAPQAPQGQSFYRSTSMQPYSQQPSFGAPPGLDRQISEVLYGGPEATGMSSPVPYMSQWGEMGPVFHHSHPTTPTHQPSQSHPGAMIGLPPSPAPPSNPSGAPWPSSPVKAMQQSAPAQRSFPANQPIATTDPRYPLYYNLCSVFAEPRVRAAMNKFPDETDPQKLCVSIVSELPGQPF